MYKDLTINRLLRMISNKKKTIINIFLNLLASVLPLGILQIFVYPNVSKTLGDDSYALMLTIYSVWVLISGTLGNSISNSKIISYSKYKDKNVVGDYLPIILKWAPIICAITFIATCYYIGNFSFLHCLFSITTAFLMFIQLFLECNFRIHIKFCDLLLSRVFLSLGYLFGYYVACNNGYWELIFLFGYSFSTIFCLCRQKGLNEKNVKTSLYKKILSECNYFAASSFISNLINYADKLILYPIIGSTMLSIYYVSTLLGKVVNIIANAIRDVLLSYISKQNKNDKKVVYYLIFIVSIISILGYFAIIWVGKYALAYLYPQLIDEVLLYLPITTVTALLDAIAVIINPFTLKYCPAKWQVIFSASTGFAYFVSSLILWNFYGLKGYCIGTVFGQIIRILLMAFAYTKSFKRNGSDF